MVRRNNVASSLPVSTPKGPDHGAATTCIANTCDAAPFSSMGRVGTAHQTRQHVYLMWLPLGDWLVGEGVKIMCVFPATANVQTKRANVTVVGELDCQLLWGMEGENYKRHKLVNKI